MERAPVPPGRTLRPRWGSPPPEEVCVVVAHRCAPAPPGVVGQEFTCPCGTRWVAVRTRWWSRRLRWERVLFALPPRRG